VIMRMVMASVKWYFPDSRLLVIADLIQKKSDTCLSHPVVSLRCSYAIHIVRGERFSVSFCHLAIAPAVHCVLRYTFEYD
jgi:hypothetical protein